MSTIRLLFAELWHRKMNVTLSLIALTAAATLFLASPTLLDGYKRESDRRLAAMQEKTNETLQQMQRETELHLAEMQKEADQNLAELNERTKRIMRDLGFNLRILHRNTDLNKLYASFVAFDMPEDYVEKLANSPEITKIVHLVATLRQMVQWEGQSRLVVGFAPEATQSHIEKKPPMGMQIDQGKVYLGALAGEGHQVGEKVDILGKTFTVARILPPSGTPDQDIALCMHLKDAQEILKKPGKISEILALGCKCKTVNRVEEITAQLEAVLPDTKVTEMSLQAIARDKQRSLVEAHYAQMMAEYRASREKIMAQEMARQQEIVSHEREHRAEVLRLLGGLNTVVTPLVVFACAVWVGMLTWSNVRDRTYEIGLLRALGKRSTFIASLFLGKALVLGLVSGVCGSVLGYILARSLAMSMFHVELSNFTPPVMLLVATVAGTPLVAVAASYLPTLFAVNQDPAVVLMDG